MKKTKFKLYKQKSAYHSPWSLSQRIALFLWNFCWAFFCSWTPKPFNIWRLFWLRLFGCKIYGKPFVHQKARIKIPWNLILRHRSCLGERANAYSLGIIEIKERAVIAQEAYLCTGTHDFSKPNIQLVTAKIIVGKGAFIGARVFIMPGVTIGDRTIIGACSLVTKDMPAGMICAGNPCKLLKKRIMLRK